MAILISILLNSLTIFVAAYILPGIHLESFTTAIVVAVVLGIVNAFIRPVLFFLTLPLNIFTLGLFTLVIIGFLVMLVSWIVPGFEVVNIWWAMLFALVVALVNSFIHTMSYSTH
ncbi:MAG: phage holin family protein [Chlamydiia bacterium]|nr:phage holin family protein [Chlamydiia bacterium]